MLAGWIWSSPIGCGDRISRPCATASRSSCDGNNPVVRSLWRSPSMASGAGNKSLASDLVTWKSIWIGDGSCKPSAGLRKQQQRCCVRSRAADTVGAELGTEEGMQIRDGFVGTVGKTPLIKLRRASEETGCTILGKAEFLNPGGSVKDRPARHMILEAEKRGELRVGGVVVESTAGNTGIGLALVANARGYRTVIVIPETQSQEKKDTLRLCGAELIEVPAVPYSNPNFYQHVGRRLAEQLRKSEPNGVIFADQWNNLDNRKAHYETTGPEIWQDTDGRIDGFICSIGTGGTIAGVSRFLRERNKDIVIGVADPRGAAMYNFFTRGEAKASEGGSITEGIGLGRVTPIVA